MSDHAMTRTASSLSVCRPLGSRCPPLHTAMRPVSNVEVASASRWAESPYRDPSPETRRMMHTLVFAALTTLGQVPELNDQSFERWRDYVRPHAKEECYLEIAWREAVFVPL